MERVFQVGISTSIPVSSIVLQLGLTVIVPLVLGQILQPYAGILRGSSAKLGILSQLALLLIIYNTFCDSFAASKDGAPVVNSEQLFCVIFIGNLLHQY